ncbi:RagB/SusD family nutrient uptake outer membrane protein [Sphingobacterium siyangense]|uniref:RagB/SusD family nutrient uptake outer membrane protein n=1 Tax=Sphingobacterium siyangense TaxID=459529 RepID=UPI003DA568B8
MKNSILHICISRLIVANLLLLPACNKLVQVETPDQLVDSEVLFQSKKGYESAMAGIFIQMRALNLSMTNGGLSVYMGIASDELSPTLLGGNYDEFSQNLLLSSNSVVNNFWVYAYRSIYRANLVIENAERDQLLSPADRDNFLGQALFVRAFLHFYLTQLFGDVPYISSSDYKINAVKGRDSKDFVMKSLLSDLERSLKLLPKEASTDRAIPNYYAALALMARVNLYQGNHEQAIANTDEILKNTSFILEADLNQVFKIKSREILWQLGTTMSNTAEGVSFIPFNTSTKPTYILREDLLQSFAPTDLRKKSWISSNTIAGVAYYYPAKYKSRLMTPIEEYNVVFRLAEIYLIRAESLYGMKQYEQATAALNVVRKRAGLSEYQFANASLLWDATKGERQNELFAEWGHRWFDLIRWNTIDTVLGKAKPTWQSYAKYLPIPSKEILLNTYLTQNPGYNE